MRLFTRFHHKSCVKFFLHSTVAYRYQNALYIHFRNPKRTLQSPVLPKKETPEFITSLPDAALSKISGTHSIYAYIQHLNLILCLCARALVRLNFAITSGRYNFRLSLRARATLVGRKSRSLAQQWSSTQAQRSTLLLLLSTSSAAVYIHVRKFSGCDS